ncbi:SUKH-4 family immunity protein [Actinoplanes sp. NPDC000266]
MTDRIRYSADYVWEVRNEAARVYLIESGIPRVPHFIEDGPSGATDAGGGPRFLLLGYYRDLDGAYYLDRESGAVWYLRPGGAFFVNSSPRQLVASFEAYLDITRGDLAGDDEAVEECLRSALRAIDPAAIDDRHSVWNDTLGDVSMGVY